MNLYAGIFIAMVLLIAAAGWRVVSTDRNPALLQEPSAVPRPGDRDLSVDLPPINVFTYYYGSESDTESILSLPASSKALRAASPSHPGIAPRTAGDSRSPLQLKPFSSSVVHGNPQHDVDDKLNVQGVHHAVSVDIGLVAGIDRNP